LFENALDSFRAVLESVKANIGEGTSRAELEYVMNMEIGYCLLSIQTKEAIAEAIQIYEDVERRHPDDAFPLYRHAQGLSLQERFEEAIEYFERARNVLPKTPGLHGHWINGALHRGLGYAYWRRSERAARDGDRARQRDLLVEAHRYTQQGLSCPDNSERQRDVTLNNLIYYETELVIWGEDKAFIEHYKAKLEDHVRQLEADFDLRKSTRVTTIHTLAMAYHVLEEMGNAYGAAQRLVALITALDKAEVATGRGGGLQPTEILSESERKMLDDGLRIMREALSEIGQPQQLQPSTQTHSRP
jgi:tetratricopeptide (TPR) repeat protein